MRTAKVTAEKTLNQAGAFSRPNSFGLPPCGTVYRAACFFRGDRNFNPPKEEQHANH